MQHGTGRELVEDAVENAIAVLADGRKRNAWPVSDVILDLHRALEVLKDESLDEPGTYGPNYGEDPTDDGFKDPEALDFVQEAESKFNV